MMRSVYLWLLVPVLVLTGCASGTEEVPLQIEVLQRTRGIIADRTGPETAPKTLRRAELDPIEDPFIEVTIEDRDQLGYMGISSQWRDDQPGNVVVWRSEDNVSLTLRNGVLIATRGLGGDVISSLVPVSGTTPGPARGGELVHRIHTGDERLAHVSMACDLVDMGPETIVIVERRHDTRHLQQRCEGAGGQIANDYWIDSRAGMVWQSRQWAGPHIGYLTMRQLTP